MNPTDAKPKIRASSVFLFLAFFAVAAFAGTITVSIGSYETALYKNDVITVPVTVSTSNDTGTATVTISPKSGLSCTTCSNSITFSAAGSQSTSFSLSATEAGTYSNPFTVTATLSNLTPGTATGSSTITVNEIPTWSLSLSSDQSSVTAGQTVRLTLTVAVTGSIGGVTARLNLPSGWTLSSGSLSQSLGTVSGTSTVSWQVAASSPSSSNALTVSVGATSPSKAENASVSISGPASGGSDSGTTSSSGSPANATPIATARPIATPVRPSGTPAPTVPGATPAPSAGEENARELGVGSSVDATFNEGGTEFVLHYQAGSNGFEGTLTHHLPLDYADYTDGLITFDPAPKTIRPGSVIASWEVSLDPNEQFDVKVAVDKALEASILEKFVAPRLLGDPKVKPKAPDAVQTVGAPAARPPASPAAGGLDLGLFASVALVLGLGVAGFLYWKRRSEAA